MNEVTSNTISGDMHSLIVEVEKKLFANQFCFLNFTTEAYLKMTQLVRDINTEVAWHGVCKKNVNGANQAIEYCVEDILVYPQSVSGATVNTDQVEYQDWLYSLDDDTFNNVRFQGHSHVKMGVSPSGVDTTHQEKIIEQLGPNDFYVFMIINKDNDMFVRIVDNEANIQFDTKDAIISVDYMMINNPQFLKDAKDMLNKKPSTSIQLDTSFYDRYYDRDRFDYKQQDIFEEESEWTW